MRPQTYVLRTENTAITTGDCFSHPKTHTHTHAYAYAYVCVCVCVCVFSEILTGIIGKHSVSAIWSCSKQFPNESLPIAQCVISDNSNAYSYHYLTSYSYKYSHTYFLHNLIETGLFSSQCLRQTETMTRFGSLLVYQTNDRPSKLADLLVVFFKICSRAQQTACFNCAVATSRTLCKLQ
jgi:hypothetical protein